MSTMTDTDLATLAKDIATELGKLRGETWTSGRAGTTRSVG